MNIENKPYLVTGANGFVGLNLVKHLVSNNIPVRAMVRDLSKAGELNKLGVEVIKGDLQDIDSLQHAVSGVSGIYHIAGLFRQAKLKDEIYYEVNTYGVKHLLDAAINAGVQRFIHCSTIGVLGDIKNPPADESTPYNPGDIYQKSKMEGEKIALSYFKKNKIRGAVIRPAMIHGPGDTRTLKLYKMISNRTFFFVGDGSIYVHWIDVRDLVKAFRLAMENQEINAKIYIVAGKSPLTLKNMVEQIATILDVPVPKLRLPVKPMQLLGTACESICRPLNIEPPIFRRRVDFFTKSRAFDTSSVRRDLGFEPDKDLHGELLDIIESYQKLNLI